jgi:hypothetical protein
VISGEHALWDAHMAVAPWRATWRIDFTVLVEGMQAAQAQLRRMAAAANEVSRIFSEQRAREAQEARAQLSRIAAHRRR